MCKPPELDEKVTNRFYPILKQHPILLSGTLREINSGYWVLNVKRSQPNPNMPYTTLAIRHSWDIKMELLHDYRNTQTNALKTFG